MSGAALRPEGPRIKQSVALVIRRASGDPDRWLIVRRPEGDAELPAVWGLPAGSYREGESTSALICRIGLEKLGVRLSPGAGLREGSAERAAYTLEMTLHEATIVSGTPRVPQAVSGVTQYTDWRWGDPATLAGGARRGSLCCRLGLALARPDRSIVSSHRGVARPAGAPPAREGG